MKTTQTQPTAPAAHRSSNPRNLPWEIVPGSRSHKASLRDNDRGIITFLDEFCEAEDRALICRAVNHHEALVKALEDSANIMDLAGRDSSRNIDERNRLTCGAEQARAAIAKATA